MLKIQKLLTWAGKHQLLYPEPLPRQISWVELPIPLWLPLQTMPLRGQKQALYLEVSPPDTSYYLSCQAFNSCYSNNLHLVLHCHRIQTHTGQIKLCHLLGCPYWPAGEPLHVLTTGCLQLRGTLSFWKTVSCFPLPDTTLLKEGRRWRVRSVMVWIFQGKKIRKNSTFLKLACEKRQGDQVNKKTENLKQQQVSICEMEMDAGKKSTDTAQFMVWCKLQACFQANQTPFSPLALGFKGNFNPHFPFHSHFQHFHSWNGSDIQWQTN